jgi:hypothetical protein
MTREEARKRAEYVVYVQCTLPDIVDRCEFADIKTHTPKGKLRSRSALEKELIEHYTDYYAED